MLEVTFDPKIVAPSTAAASARPSAAGGDFAAALKAALDGVNASQADADKLARAFQSGDSAAGLEETMVAIAKANVSFQTLVQVRNKLVAAYNEIMNLQL